MVGNDCFHNWITVEKKTRDFIENCKLRVFYGFQQSSIIFHDCRAALFVVVFANINLKGLLAFDLVFQRTFNYLFQEQSKIISNLIIIFNSKYENLIEFINTYDKLWDIDEEISLTEINLNRVVILIINSNMDRHRPAAANGEEARSRNQPKIKENPLNDAVYLIQNQNDVLRIKNEEISQRIKELKAQLQVCSDSILLRESEIEKLRCRIKGNAYKEDIEIENQKRLLEQKINLLRSDEEMLLRKIGEAREATIFEEQKIMAIQNDKKGLQIEILSMRAQNEGTKIMLRNLEEQNEQLRIQNQKLVNKRKVYEPKQRDLSIQIEERIRFIKNQQHNLKNLRLYETSKLIVCILTIIYTKKIKSYFMQIERYAVNIKLAKKKIFNLSIIRRKYILFIKNKVLQHLRNGFKPLIEQQTAKRIINEIHKRRVRAIIWRKWRKAAKQAEYRTIRSFQFQNLMEKLSESFAKCNLFAAFNMLKYYKNNPLKQTAAIVIERIFNHFMNRSKTYFFSNLRSAQNHYEIGLQIDASSKEQTQILVQSLYFSAWATLTKSHRIENKSIKRRYFKELKKLISLKRRRVLGQMLMNTNERIKNVDLESKAFTRLKKEAIIEKIHKMNEQNTEIQSKSMQLQQNIIELHSQKKQLYQELALIKVSKYLKTKMQKAFDLWRLRKQQSKVLLAIINMVQSKKTFDKNFAFSKILKKRFFMLKKSISDKIQSCQFSYNYLLDENRHIKQVLDKKQHQLQKTKFMSIIKRIIKEEKEVKLKYFYKFMKNGFKYWKFRKTIQRIDKMVDKRVKIVFMWLLKQNIKQIKEEHRIQNFVEEKERIINTKLLKNAINGFKLNVDRNRRFRRVIGGIFERNLELDYYAAYGKIRNIEHIQNRRQLQNQIDHLRGQTQRRNAKAEQQERNAKILAARLKDKQQIFQERKILTLYNFFSKNVVKKVSSYIQRWKTKVQRENNVLTFAKILQRKSRILLKSKFLLAIDKQNQDQNIGQLKDKLKKYQNEYQSMSHDLERFISESEKQAQKMKSQSQINKKEGQYLQKKTDFMTNLKIKSFSQAWGKKLLAFVFKYWRQQTDIFINTWTNLDKKFSVRIKKETFPQFSRQMLYMIQNDRIRKNLSRIYHTAYLHNVGLGFRTWRIVYYNKKKQLWTEEQIKQKKKFQGLEKKYNYAINLHNKQVDFRLFDSLNRSVFNQWRKYAEIKVRNKQKSALLEEWLTKGVAAEFISLLKSKVNKKIAFKERLRSFKNKWNQVKMRAFLTYTSLMKVKRKAVDRLFIHKFCPFLKYKLFEDFFTRVKNYCNKRDQDKLTDQTVRMQTVIETFEKIRKNTLNTYLRRWRRNQYQMMIQRNLMRRITKNAMNWRVKDLFYSWKLEAEAKRVKYMHEEEGQVKKRKIEINRLKLFLQDFKKEKGLLLQDDAGQLVVSPRFQQKKEQQIKKDNNFRYKFISRLILSMNGYSAPVKAFNNLKTYMIVRQKYKKYAQFVRNNLRKPDLFYAFRIWHKATLDFNNTFETMERKSLIKILNRQKDKMEMEYTKKVSLEQKIRRQMDVHKVLAYQEDRKQKLCAHVFIKNLRKVQLYGLLTWKKRVSQMKQSQLEHLQEMGGNKIASMEDEVNELEELERELRENNAKLESAVQEAVEIAQMVKRITEERDLLSKLLAEKQFTCESLQQENEELNAKLHLAQKEAMNLLILSGNKL